MNPSSVAIHEAAHAVVAEVVLGPEAACFVTLHPKPEDDATAYCRLYDSARDKALPYQALIVSLAGPAADRWLCGGIDLGAADRDKVDAMLSFQPGKDREGMLRSAEVLAGAYVQLHAEWITRVAEELDLRGHVVGSRVRELRPPGKRTTR